MLHVDLLMLTTHKQCCVTVMLNKRRYRSDIALFDMLTVILHNTFNFFQDHDTARCDIFFCLVIVALFSNPTILNFHPR